MKIINLSGADLPNLQGVESAPDEMIAMFKKTMADPNLTDSHIGGSFRGTPFGYAIQQEYMAAARVPAKDKADAIAIAQAAKDSAELKQYVHDQEPWLIVLPKDRQSLAEMLCFLQIGPAPGTEFALLIPVEARNRQWFYSGTKSEIRIPVIFEVDQNGNVVGLSNFVHRTPPIKGAQIVPEG